MTQTKSGKNLQATSRLQEFLVDEIRDIYWAEKHLVKTIQKMQKAANSREIKNPFAEHLESTK